MKRAKLIREVQFPQDIGSLIAETSHVDLRMVPPGARFIDPERVGFTDLSGPILLVVCTPGFLGEVLQALEKTREDIWVMLAGTDAEQVATMFSQNLGWTLVARAMVTNTLVLQVRPSEEPDQSLAGIITGLRLATVLDAARVGPPTLMTAPSSTPKRPATFLSQVKRRIPRRAKTLAKKALARR